MTNVLPPGPRAAAAATNGHARRRKRAQRLAAHLVKLTASYPEFRRALAESLDLVKEQIDRCPESDRQLILSAIHLGAWTIHDLISETNLTRAEIQKHLDALLAQKVIFRTESPHQDDLGGRPKILWFPAPNFEPAPRRQK